MSIDWLHVILASIAALWAILGPIVLKKNARLHAIVTAVISGVEDGDHDKTKDAIAKAAASSGIGDHLDDLVQKHTKDGAA